MRDALLLLAALAANLAGLGWLALAMDTHWQQVRGALPLAAGQARLLRLLGAGGLLAALLLCQAVDHLSMAVLVWFMSLAGSALLLAFILASRPGWLRPLVIWLRPAR